MTDDTLLAGFKELFRGNGDAYGLVHGQCVRMPVTDECWRSHLFGEGSLGIYPVVQLVCRWACSDIDTHGPQAFTHDEARVHARNLVTALEVLGHHGWVELTKSGGYHVWLFAQDWCDAQVMRSVLLLAHQLADVPAREVNPKDALGVRELGNYVNLPYARAWVSKGTRFMVNPLPQGGMGAWLLREFVEKATSARSTPAQLDETARLYVPPPPPAPVTMRPFTGRTEAPSTAGTSWANHKDIEDDQLREAVSMLSGKGWIIFKDGPNQGGRALTLFRLGVECRESGLGPDEAMIVLVDADWRWGKFMSGVDGHHNGIKYIEDIVRKVYG